MTSYGGALDVAKGDLTIEVIRNNRKIVHHPTVYVGHETESNFWKVLTFANPFAKNLPKQVRIWRLKNSWNIIKNSWKLGIASFIGAPHFFGALYLKRISSNGDVMNFGLASVQKVTNVGVNEIVDAFQNSGTDPLDDFKYHGIGLGNTAESNGDTAIETELTTQYTTDNTRATGTQAEGATANIFKTVATNNVDGTVAIVEHGIMDQAAVGGGILLDRSVFTVINLVSGDGLQSTYQLTINSES